MEEEEGPPGLPDIFFSVFFLLIYDCAFMCGFKVLLVIFIFARVLLRKVLSQRLITRRRQKNFGGGF